MKRLTVLLLLLPFAVACGAKESGFAESEEALKNAGSSRVEMTFVDSETPYGFSATGSIDYARDRGELVIKSTSMNVAGGEMYARFIGQTTYFGWALLGKMRWQKESDYAPAGTERFQPGPGGPNPDQLLGMLIKASKNIETLGNDEIRGVSAKHYRAHIDKKALGEDAAYLPDEVVIDAWVDEDGLVRRLRLPESDTSATVVDLYDFGVEVDVEAPPTEEILTEEEFNKLAEQECAQLPEEGREESFACLMSGDLVSGMEEGPVETVPRTEAER